MKNKHLPHLLTFLIVLIGVAGNETRAQNPATTISLNAEQQKLSRLAPGQTSGQVVFSVDSAGQITIEILATISSLSTSIVGPGGQLITPATIGGLGGEFSLIEGGTADSFLILGAASPGFHYLYAFPSLGAGNYTVRFDAGASLSEEVAVISRVVTDSPIGAALFSTDPTLVIGSTAVLTAAIFAGPAPVAGASVTVDVVPPSGSIFTLTLKDDGASASGDDTAGDGLYSAQFMPAVTGNFRASAVISGTTGGGIAFIRNAATTFDVIPQHGRLTGVVTDQGVDDNGDTLFDRVAIDVQTNITLAGKYLALVHLKTTNGQTLLRSSEVTLTTGLQNIRVNFEAAAFLELGENGPYTMELIELVRIDPVTGSSPADTLANVGQTAAYLLSQFQRPSASLTGTTSDQGVDDNGNGKFDRLLVSVQVNVLTSGFYSWGFKLTDQGAHEIDFASGSAFFSAGLNNLNVTFSGLKIGAFGANGPYQLRDLLLQGGQGTSLVAIEIGSTQPYQFTQFEGVQGNQAPTLNATPTSQTVQYSDAIANVTITASDAETAPGALTISTTWTKNGGAPSPGLPANLVLTDAGVNSSSQRVWTISGIANVETGTYAITSTVTDTGGAEPPKSSQSTISIIVNKEDVGTTYTGDVNIFTAGPKVSTATVRLGANLTEEADGSPGDLTLARVVFELFQAGNVGSTPDLTVGPVSVNSSGQALTFINLGVGVWTVRVKVEPNNGYWTASPVAISLINVALGTNERGTTGGGWIADSLSANGKGNFGFNVGYLKNGNTKGNSVYVYRGADGFTYLVKSTSWQGGGLSFLTVNNSISRAAFSGRCVVQKISDSGQIVESFAGSFSVDVNDGDLHTPRQQDGYAITILDSTGNIYRQVGGLNALLPLNGGNVRVQAK